MNNTVAVAVNPFNSYLSVNIVGIEYGINDYILFTNEPDYKKQVIRYFHKVEERTFLNTKRNIYKSKIIYNEDGEAYFNYSRKKIFLSDCIITNFIK